MHKTQQRFWWPKITRTYVIKLPEDLAVEVPDSTQEALDLGHGGGWSETRWDHAAQFNQ